MSERDSCVDTTQHIEHRWFYSIAVYGLELVEVFFFED